jgi:squalene cyclase
LERPERLRPSLEAAERFIEASVDSNGFWSDFLTLAGESVYWVTGYVGYALAGGVAPGDRASEALLSRAGSAILQRQAEDGGWGYGPGVPSDADSTSWCLLFLARLGTQGADSRERALRFLRTHQSPDDGGFRTYAKPREVGRYMMLDASVSFEGWSSSQMCVTPVAGRAMLEAGSAQGVDRALAFVRRGQRAEGYWDPYWWSERLYATTNCVELLVAGGDAGDAALVQRAQDWIAASQLGSGAWSDSPTTPGVPFSTALALSGLMATPRPEFAEKVGAGVEWLLTDQLADGSWNSHHILRIPHPSTREPWKQPLWTRDGKAINAVIRDHRRLYTTATAYAALSRLDRKLSEGGL